MKRSIHFSLLISLIVILPLQNWAQTINLGAAADYVLYSTDGAVTNSGITHLTGNVGTNNGSSTGFGNVNGGMHDGDASSIQAAADILVAYGQLNAATPTNYPAPLLGNGQILFSGVNNISAPATLNLNLILDAQGDQNAVFIFQIQGAFSASAGSSIQLINGALACNVYWKVEGLVSLASGTSFKGTILANNSAIMMNTGDTLEGRALAIAGAVTVDGIHAYTPIGCGSPMLTGPQAPDLGAAACYAIFSTDGAVVNTGISTITGDVGSNNGSVSGFDPLLVSGEIHAIPDGSTAACAADLLVAYNYLNTLPVDIELLYPAQFGNNLVLTPHTYLMGGAATFTDSLYLDGQGNPDGVFVIRIAGAMSTSTYSKVILTNGTQAKNVYWQIEGAVDINDYSVFNGNIICNNAALGSIATGVELNGRALTTAGALSTAAMSALPTNVPANCVTLNVATLTDLNTSFIVYPNPFTAGITIETENFTSGQNFQLSIANTLGEEVLKTKITKASTKLKTDSLPSGFYFYTIIANEQIIQTGKLMAK
ncbi:MAG: ice-binding family protein [Crocinitomicaceae bacterium]